MTDQMTPVVDTDRDELRRETGAALDRFAELARRADPAARVPGSPWTVADVVAHVLTVTHRYAAVARGEDFERAEDPRDLAEINQRGLEALTGSVEEHLAEIQALVPGIEAWFDRVADEPAVMPFHAGKRVSGEIAQVNWLSELLFHGADVAAAVGERWELPERAMTLLLLLAQELGPVYLRPDLPASTELMVEVRVKGARPSLWHVHDGRLDIRSRVPGDKPDAVLRGPAPVVASLLYQRMTPLAAARRGLLVTGGRRPWRAMRMPGLFLAP